ncbi:TMEM175 family protein [Methanoregula sp.]|uniref:TMEM175 family protein n=1 Tax=Methanoregula sp. TaxID=2052170 RepID=UPI003C737024
MKYANPEDPRTQYMFFKNFERVISFSDGVFSIAITLMVLSLAVPAIAQNDATVELPIRLLSEWPTFFIYIISFIIIGNWWVSHHRIFQHINRADRTLLWLNLLFLLFITLIPFETTLIIQYPGVPTAVAFYAFTQALAGLILVSLWYHATSGRRLSDPDLSQVTVQYYIIRGILGSATYLISIGIAAFNVYIAQLSWLLIGILFWWLGREFYRNDLPIIDQTE